jgi:hypothetical protein
MKTVTRLAAFAALTAALAGGLAACGKQGVLERPAPLFGAKAKAQYEAEKAAEARAAAEAAARRDAANGNQRDNSENAPPTTRSVRDPAQVLRPASQAPIAGAPSGPGGAPPSVSPPN